MRLIQTMIITLEGGGVNRVMVSFSSKLNYAKIKDNYMQVYNKQNKDNYI